MEYGNLHVKTVQHRQETTASEARIECVSKYGNELRQNISQNLPYIDPMTQSKLNY